MVTPENANFIIKRLNAPKYNGITYPHFYVRKLKSEDNGKSQFNASFSGPVRSTKKFTIKLGLSGVGS